MGRCLRLTLPECCFRPYLQGYRPLLAYWLVWDVSPSDSVVRMDPGGTLSSSGLVGIMVSNVSAELPSLIGPVKTLGALSPSDCGSVGPMGPMGMLSSSVFECASPVDPVSRGNSITGREGSGYYTTAHGHAGG